MDGTWITTWFFICRTKCTPIASLGYDENENTASKLDIELLATSFPVFKRIHIGKVLIRPL